MNAARGTPFVSVVDVNVLVIDDDQDIAALLRDVLDEAGHHATVIDRPEAAATVRERPELVISDLYRDTGYDEEGARSFVRGLRERFAAPVIICTAHADALRAGDALGADAVIGKPFEVEDLLATVGRFG